MSSNSQNKLDARVKACEMAITSLPRPFRMSDAKIEREIFGALELCEVILRATTKQRPESPSKSEREWKRFANDITKLAAKVRRLTPQGETSLAQSRKISDWSGAAHALSRMDGGMTPPHTKPVRQVWSAEKGLIEVGRSLDWLCAVTNLAADRAAAEKAETGGAMPDPSNDALIKALASIYIEATARKIDWPFYYSSRRREGGWVGKFLDFAAPILTFFAGNNREQTAWLIQRALRDWIKSTTFEPVRPPRQPVKRLDKKRHVA